MTALDRVLVSIDRRPLDAVLRAVLGFVAIPVLSFFRQDVRSGWTLSIGLLLLMFALRIVPAVMRRILRPSPEANAIWAERRQVAKRYDSFQWQKLFFTGIGLACYVLLSRQLLPSSIAVSSFCIVFGAIGVFRWYMQATSVRNTMVNKYVL